MNPERLAERRAQQQGIRTRIRLIAHERNICPDETKKALSLRHYDLMRFAKKHSLSLDWLISGDLKGLLRMVRGQCARNQQSRASG
jgi:hypothetical protein